MTVLWLPLLVSFLGAFVAIGPVHGQEEELPITASDVVVQTGELSDTSAVVMVRCNQEVDSVVSIALKGGSDQALDLGTVTSTTDYTVSYLVSGLTKLTAYEYVATCTAAGVAVTSTTATFTTLPGPDDAEPISFVWAADLAGQGWGRNPDWTVTTVDGRTVTGGYVVFDVMEQLRPNFALFQGDMIYADNAIPPTKEIPEALGGGNWTNNPSKDFVAITLDEFRANWKYNLGDEKMQSFLAKTPIYVQWDDHEVTNNWYPGEILEFTNDLYPNNTVVDEMYLNSLQAFYEFNPLLPDSLIFRHQRVGRHLEIFFVDYRSYRDPNLGNSDPNGIAMMGAEQLAWLKEKLSASTATWKIISSHDPFSIVTGGPTDRDAFGQEDPAILGREFELRDLFEHIRVQKISGVVSLTSDVHYTAHIQHHPDRATGGFTDFTPLDEFVIGPIHAGAFGPNTLDTSFGPEYVYVRGPNTTGYEVMNLPPLETSLQSFGYAAVSSGGDLTIQLIDITGKVTYEKTMKSLSGGDDAVEKCIRR